MPTLRAFIAMLEAKQQRLAIANEGLTVLRQILLSVEDNSNPTTTWPKGSNRQRVVHKNKWATECVVVADQASIDLYPPQDCSPQVIQELRELLPKNLLRYRVIDRHFLKVWL